MTNILLRVKLWMTEDNNVFYINGSDTLPPPLSKAEENAVMERIRAGIRRAGDFLAEACKIRCKKRR